ncbi:MAG TPA: type IV secretory system conjugative DNA transfer family protein, partial [Caulobacter sp.]|nr:type IV secretory system conjugative DNA transfer family protein [Caulobacter sp.]
LGTATEIRDARNYAGHRLSPWLGHLMVSRQETARPLLTPGEIMQLPPSDAIVLVSGLFPVRATKARYYEDRQLKARLLPPPTEPTQREEVGAQSDDWSALAPLPFAPTAARTSGDDAIDGDADDSANAGIRREPEIPAHEAIAPETPLPVREFDALDDEPDD